MTAMMHARQIGHSCRVAGHGSRCEVSRERGWRDRAVEKREWHREIEREESP